MDKGLYVAMTGASATLQAQASVAQNLANVSTAGFKAHLVNTEAFTVPGAGLPTRIDAMLISNGFNTDAGSVIQTGRSLDVTFGEDKWLAVQARDGGEAYTRNGALQVNATGQLTTAGGNVVLGQGGPISIPPNEQVSIGADGTISITPQGQGPETVAIIGRLRVVNAPSASLTRRDDGLMGTRDKSVPGPAAGNVLASGAFEGSNVNTADMLVQMIQLSRQFEMQVKILKAGDENARSANSLLRLG